MTSILDTVELTDEQRDVLRKIEKLFRLAGRSESKEEAASATAKATELMEAYNLSSSQIGASDDDGKRADEKLRGGHYDWQMDLMRRIAELNFCWAWCQHTWVDRPANEQNHAKVLAFRSYWRQRHKKISQYRIIGRPVNVVATVQTYQYILESTERLTRDFLTDGLLRHDTDAERVVGMGAALRSRRACSFREGVAAAVSSRLWDRRTEQRNQARSDQQKMREQAEEALRERAARSGGTRQALTLSQVREAEDDANQDHIYGEGYSARQRAERAAQAAAARAAEEEYTRWAAANPEEAAEEEKKRREEQKKAERRWARRTGPGSRGGTSHEKQVDWGAYSAGSEAGKKLGIDPQARSGGGERRIGRTAGLLEHAS